MADDDVIVEGLGSLVPGPEGRHSTGGSDSEMCGGNPQTMWDYADAGADRTNSLLGKLGALNTALATYRQHAAYTVAEGVDIDSNIGQVQTQGGPQAPGASSRIEDAIADLIADREHLDNFVSQVGTAFYRADQANPAPDHLADGDPDRIMAFSAGDLLAHGDIGFADSEAERERLEGVEDVAELERLMGESGIDIADFDPESLGGLDPGDDGYVELYDHLKAMTGRMDGEGAYSSHVFDALGVDGIQATLGTIEMYQQQQVYGAGADVEVPGVEIEIPEMDVEGELLNPFLDSFASSTHTMNDDVLSGLLDHEGETWQLHQLATLQGADGSLYEPGWLADASHEVLFNDDVWAGPSGIGASYPPLAGSGTPLWENIELSFPHLTSVSALADNPEAAWQFMGKGDDHIELILRPPADDWIDVGDKLHDPFGSNAFSAAFGEAEVQGLIHQYTAETMVGGLFTHPTQNGMLDDPRQTAMVSYAISSAADWELLGKTFPDELSPQMQAAVATVSGPYTRDLAMVLNGDDPDDVRLDLQHPYIESPADITRGFMQQVSKSPRGRDIMSANGAALVSVGMLEADISNSTGATGPEVVADYMIDTWANPDHVKHTDAYFSGLISAWDDLNTAAEADRQQDVDNIALGGRVIANIVTAQMPAGSSPIAYQAAGEFAEWAVGDADTIPIADELDNQWGVVGNQAAETLWNDPDLRQAVINQEATDRPGNVPADPSTITKEQFMELNATKQVAINIETEVSRYAEGSAATESLFGND